ncbi:thiamine-phosphate kinase [Candidatus Methylacidiphilum fumarolicum]|nr:thiamine-phosphate kinase [Candidatus Methylacidiphilum fumarolicum]TFE73233.1 thiamine-phosphate kinase [Candidatus Methylacidiphilum fumarolicum]TFE73260.1 thiamine-phosphate kinase [Candidatus Methylacidiphilum fumarolicum]
MSKKLKLKSYYFWESIVQSKKTNIPFSLTTESLVSDLSEEQLINLLVEGWAKSKREVIASLGEDCAVIQSEKKELYYLFKMDATVENVHFDPSTPPEWVGRKALARALSDIASMGGEPLYGLIGLGVNRTEKVEKIKQLYKGLTELARAIGMDLIGGETTESNQLFIVVTVWGKTDGYKPILRSGAEDGDSLFVTGVLGGSYDSGHHLFFIPRIKEGQWLAKGQWAKAMIDLSDGLATDLPRMAKASNVGFEIDYEAIPARKNYGLHNALTDGEDYELLFSVAKEKEIDLLKHWPFEVPIKKIGTFSKNGKMEFQDGYRGFDHFQKSRGDY